MWPLLALAAVGVGSWLLGGWDAKQRAPKDSDATRASEAARAAQRKVALDRAALAADHRAPLHVRTQARRTARPAPRQVDVRLTSEAPRSSRETRLLATSSKSLPPLKARSSVQAANDLLYYLTRVQTDPAAWGSKLAPNAVIQIAQRDMGKVKADGDYGAKTQARAQALTGRAFPLRDVAPKVVTATVNTPRRAQATSLAKAQATAPARAPLQAALDLYVYVTKTEPNPEQWGSAARAVPNPVIAAAQRDMGLPPPYGSYGPVTQRRAASLTGKVFPTRHAARHGYGADVAGGPVIGARPLLDESRAALLSWIDETKHVHVTPAALQSALSHQAEADQWWHALSSAARQRRRADWAAIHDHDSAAADAGNYEPAQLWFWRDSSAKQRQRLRDKYIAQGFQLSDVTDPLLSAATDTLKFVHTIPGLSTILAVVPGLNLALPALDLALKSLHGGKFQLSDLTSALPALAGVPGISDVVALAKNAGVDKIGDVVELATKAGLGDAAGTLANLSRRISIVTGGKATPADTSLAAIKRFGDAVDLSKSIRASTQADPRTALEQALEHVSATVPKKPTYYLTVTPG